MPPQENQWVYRATNAFPSRVNAEMPHTAYSFPRRVDAFDFVPSLASYSGQVPLRLHPNAPDSRRHIIFEFCEPSPPGATEP